MIKKLKLREIVCVRGLSLQINDIEYEEDMIDTLMWNPLQFAVYHQNYDLVKYFISEMRVNVGLTGPKANADNEKDAVNTEKYPEDKIMLLLLAYDRRDTKVLSYLLDELYQFWPISTVEQLLVERFNTDVIAWQQEDN